MGMKEKLEALFLVAAIVALWVPMGISHTMAMIISSVVIGVVAAINFFVG